MAAIYWRFIHQDFLQEKQISFLSVTPSFSNIYWMVFDKLAFAADSKFSSFKYFNFKFQTWIMLFSRFIRITISSDYGMI